MEHQTKRRKTSTLVDTPTPEQVDIDTNTLKDWNTQFNADPTNKLIKNVVVSVGSTYAAIDEQEVRKTTHLFMNSIKKHNLKATNQGHSGRCWMFSGLNTFRHFLIKALNLTEFEFSETYLFFYDKLERANYLLQWFIDNPDHEIDSREVQHMVDTNYYYTDGGYWEMFTNLVKKYGVVPKSAMPETWQSVYSDDLNSELVYRILACANWLHTNRHRDRQFLLARKNETIQQVYNILAKFLGEPPTEFTWRFTIDDEYQTNVEMFSKMIFPHLDLDDFVVLANFPSSRLEQRKRYQVRMSSNMVGGQEPGFVNLPIYELKKYTRESILSGKPVWFSADVSHGFNFESSTLNNRVSNTDLLLGKPLKFEKGSKIDFRVANGNHAMVILGVNFDNNGNPTAWQVENSWGFYDNEERGLDGFLSMNDEWFEENVMQVVIHKSILSRSILKLLDEPPMLLDPWDATAPALMIKSRAPPADYLQRLRRGRNPVGDGAR
jgi:bleomycin hydrolase